MELQHKLPLLGPPPAPLPSSRLSVLPPLQRPPPQRTHGPRKKRGTVRFVLPLGGLVLSWLAAAS
eukprot:1153157-Pelagomonas_calceolata.AAC.2